MGKANVPRYIGKPLMNVSDIKIYEECIAIRPMTGFYGLQGPARRSTVVGSDCILVTHLLSAGEDGGYI